MDWYQKLSSWGVPSPLAARMSRDLSELPYSPDQFTSMNQLIPIMQSHGMQTMAWWDDLMMWLEEAMQLLMEMMPGIILTTVGAAMAYFLRNVKVKNVPLSIVGLPPIGYGVWLMVQPLLSRQ